MLLPSPRGPLSEWTVETLIGRSAGAVPFPAIPRPLTDHDLHLALWTLYELHYRGFDDVDADLEWDPTLLRARRGLEHRFLEALRHDVRVPAGSDVVQRLGDVADGQVTGGGDGPSIATYLRRQADVGQFTEFVKHRSIYHLKEADPHTFAIPRLAGAPKAAFIEIQADEYGGGRYHRMHATLFAALMRELGLDDTYGRYVSEVPGVTLATNNLMSLFGLHRRWRGAIAGHLALIEMTSSLPSRRYAQALRRLGGTDTACRFFDEHVEADAVHEQIALHDLCAGLVRADPGLEDDIVFGAACAVHLDVLFAQHVVGAWTVGHTSLVDPVVGAAA